MNGPKIWEKLFDSLLPVYGSALIAGGSPRDYTVNKRLKPKDIDVFVPIDSEFDLELSTYDLNRSGFSLVLLMDGKRSGYSADELAASNVRGVLEAQFDQTTVNIVGKSPDKIEDVSELIRDFDHSLCHFWVTPDDPKVVQRTADADLTLATKRVTLYTSEGLITETLEKRTADRLNRLAARKAYEGFDWPEKGKKFKFNHGSTTTLYQAHDEFLARNGVAQVNWGEILQRPAMARFNLQEGINQFQDPLPLR